MVVESDSICGSRARHGVVQDDCGSLVSYCFDGKHNPRLHDVDCCLTCWPHRPSDQPLDENWLTGNLLSESVWREKVINLLLSTKGPWWSRRLVSEYFPAIDAKHPSISKFLSQFGWKSELAPERAEPCSYGDGGARTAAVQVKSIYLAL
jgi:hypothetical protein